MARSDRQVAALERHRSRLDLRHDGLGEDLCKIATDGVLECIIGEHGPDGSAWPDLDARYEAWKARHYPGRPMGVKDFVMARPEEVAGEVVVESDRATVTYGISDRARVEAAWFQVLRPFWGFTDRSRSEVRGRLARSVGEILRG